MDSPWEELFIKIKNGEADAVPTEHVYKLIFGRAHAGLKRVTVN